MFTRRTVQHLLCLGSRRSMAQSFWIFCLTVTQRPNAVTSIVFSSSICFKVSEGEGDEPGTITHTETARASI
jgi:hypothetical protein